ncbi:MAG: M48 family metallopeptidase [Parachlamydiales bacterium]|nr:M48 family metallopeptidase [Parachlamydiales bacterium]
MAFDFWKAQRSARWRTALYISTFSLFALIIGGLSEWAVRLYADPKSYNPPYPYVWIGFVAVTFLVAGFHYITFCRSGGEAVADSVGAVLVPEDIKNPKYSQLINVVKEITIAAQIPMPKVYVMPSKQINAFAAGTNPTNCVITVTQGALDRLTRDELQGVIAHECSHIYNKDVLISMRLAALVMGFFFMLYLGFRLMEGSLFFGGGDRDDRRSNGNGIVIAGLILTVAGAVTWIAGAILKSMVSRQREYLADASSVQFTRNPDGLISALKKIEKDEISDMPKQGLAFSHLYFNDRSLLSNLFATHPPIEKRIALLKGHRP